MQTDAADQLVLELKTPWCDGTTHLVMSPLELMQRLAARVPRPRLQLIASMAFAVGLSEDPGAARPSRWFNAERRRPVVARTPVAAAEDPMNEDLQRMHDTLVGAFMALSPALFVAIFAILLGLLLWALRQALRNLRIGQAVAKAPLVDLRSTAAGLVKIRGTAQPPEPRPGRAPSSIVWYSRHRRSGSDTSTFSTTDNFVIRDAHGDCAVNTGKTTILPSASLATQGFLDKSRSSVERALYTGDAVFALGALRSGLPPLSGVGHARCQLVRSSGVLLVSGASEREAKVLHALWSIVQAPLALLCLGLLGFGTWAHLIGYPPGNDGPAATFLEALRTTPWKGEAGPDHPLWLKTPAVPASRPPP